MYARFKWTQASVGRLNLTVQYEPVQPFLFVQFARAMAASHGVDVGANIGQYSLFASQATSVKTIYAFEPEETAFGEMNENIRQNGLSNVIQTLMRIVSSTTGPVEFSVVGAMAGNNAVSATSIHDQSVYKETRSLKADTLDNILSLKGDKIIMKIDVEGHETDVLSGATRLLSSNDIIIQIEIYNNETIVTGLLEKLGYRKILSAGPDFYFSNINQFFDPGAVVTVVEAAFASMIAYNLRG